uniref:RING-type domain-containing protein n=1 Tax=Acanthochromis polyacanthus TaxID=80966 RepID=A0A3Q1F2Q9_9TELE
MALNYQASTLSLTLPISCQICLGKVRQPVICANHHVFCSSCMEMWLKKASQCPSCRVPITPENPCREIIGGTNEGDHSDSPPMRKCLRKTRGELLLREYEEEIEGLMRENEELKTKNHSLEAQLRTALDPCSINTEQPDDKRVAPLVLEEWTNKLRAATDVCDKVKQDMDKLKEANKALRSQNVDLVQENMRLKAEVASRSPQNRCGLNEVLIHWD